MGWANGSARPAGYGPSGSSAPGKLRKRSASGHAAANVKATAARCLDNTGGDFQGTKTQRCELGGGQFPGFGNGVAHGKPQPISGGMENEADLVGKRRTA